MNKLNFKLLKLMSFILRIRSRINLSLTSTSFSNFVLKNKNRNSKNNIINYSTVTKVNEPLEITLQFITGFANGEGSFILGLQERS